MANEWTKRVKTRSVYQASDLFLENDIKECVAWFLPKWAYYVARSFLFDYGQRRTSFALDYRVGLYLIPDDGEWNVIEDEISEALGGDIVCVQDIVSALDGISVAIAAQSASGCGAGDCSEGYHEYHILGFGLAKNGESNNANNWILCSGVIFPYTG